MKSATRGRRVALALSLALAGCQQILGIEEQKLAPENGGRDAGRDGGGGDADIEYESPSEEDCAEYCGLLDEVCSASSPNASFAEASYCPATCSYMLRTSDRSVEGNTFDCRFNQANLAKIAGVDNSTECRRAGAGSEECGSTCEGYCQLYASICGAFPELQRSNCVTECEKLLVDTGRNAKEAFASGRDTLQCRLAHLGAASNPGLSETHCPHAALEPPVGSPCFKAEPECEDYCALSLKACTGDMQQYDNEADCVAACSKGMTKKETLPDFDQDTVVCRRYHIYNAIKVGGTHCEHGGPAGDGHCGRICPAYCKLVKAACSADGYATAYPGGDPDCLADCKQVIGNKEIDDQADEHYNVAKGKMDGNTTSCRIYHTVKAFRTPALSCPSALGLPTGRCAPD